MLEGRSQPTGAYIFYTIYLFCTIFLINFLLPSGSPLHTPPNFLFSRLHFATTIRDSLSRLHFTTPLTTPIHDSHSRLMFATPLATPIRYSRSRLTFATHDHDPIRVSLFSRLPRHATPQLMDGLFQHPSVISLAFQP